MASVSLIRRLTALALTFGKLGAVTFGGGYAMIAVLEDEIVTRRKWLSSDELADIITIAESTPGPIAVNAATFVGYKLAGLPGGILATLSLVFPAWLTIVLLSTCYLALRDNRWVAAALAGIRIGAIILIARACWRMGRKMPRTVPTCLLCGAAFLGVVSGILPAIWAVGGGLLAGAVFYGLVPWFSERRGA